MRILKNERKVIVDSVKKYDCDAQILLFGSRMDDRKKGGDIDLLLFSDVISKKNILNIENSIFKKIDEQKIDFVISKKNNQNNFVKLILEKGVVDLCLSMK